MKQLIANALQGAGAIGVTLAAAFVNPVLGLFVGSVLAVVAGVAMERS
jgi:hypothetical protein